MPGRELEVILTHEHTDFDALASLFAASLLFPNATPVLPHQMNRNIREFLALYRSHLPFVSPEDLPRARIKHAIIVDTHAINAPRGFADGAEILFIDHHASAESAPLKPPRGDRSTPGVVQVWSEATGANTTLLLEKIIAQQLPLTPVQATLLALGIHEDTGSLTYGGSTHRDAHCLAWLLEPDRGVNLNVLNQFLHHPLGEQQRSLLQELISQSEFLQISGHNVVIAQAAARGFGEEISTVAARLRDFHENDAVFLIIDLGDLVQMVARSTTDEVDVGAIARALGGGGHTRAAAAPLHGVAASVVRDRIVTLIQEHASVAVTVRDIMSSGRPQTLTAEMSIEDAATLMRRYGHEGFPVVAGSEGNEELIGMLTRREADRAMSHGLGDQPVRRFLRAGRITIHPDDSIPVLRRTMIDSGWGQIPVVDQHNRIVGIVTRTDLIKLWDDRQALERRPGELARRLVETLTPVQHHLLQLIGKEVDRMDYAVYVVGGFVRDLLLNSPSERVYMLDVDIVIEGDAIEFARRMQRLYGGRVVEHKQFGTAKWLLKDTAHPVQFEALTDGMTVAGDATMLPPHLDFVTARTEFYTAPTVLPTVESSSIKLDLHRRDFTINTLALCLNPDRWGQLLDFYGGVNDLQQRVVRVLHSLSFVDDPTRILRAVRYEQRFNFTIDPRTLELIDDALDMFDRVTPARIRHEFERILQEAQPEKILLRLDELGILQQIHTELHADAWVAVMFARLRAEMQRPTVAEELADTAIERLYWAVLVYHLPEEADAAVQERLGLRQETQRIVQGLHWLRQHIATLSDPALLPSKAVELLDQADAVSQALLCLLCDDETLCRTLTLYRETWRTIHPELDGNDLRALGVPRGPIYRTILAELRAARLDGAAQSREDEIRLALQYAATK